jgi:hypothetical protein
MSVTEGRPSVIRTRLVEMIILTLCVILERLTAFDQKCRFRHLCRLPDMIAVGVARPRAQGQAMTRTAIRIESAKTSVWPAISQAAAARTAIAKTIGTK